MSHFVAAHNAQKYVCHYIASQHEHAGNGEVSQKYVSHYVASHNERASDGKVSFNGDTQQDSLVLIGCGTSIGPYLLFGVRLELERATKLEFAHMMSRCSLRMCWVYEIENIACDVFQPQGLKADTRSLHEKCPRNPLL